MVKEKKSQRLTTPSDLKEKSVQEIASYINPLIADAFALYVKTKSYHWHLSGPHFRDYHLLFDEQAAQILASIDILAERLRKLGQETIYSISHISHLQTLKDEETAFVEPEKMLQNLMKDNLHVTASLRKAHAICDKHKDVATASLLEVFIDETERRTWFLFETLS